MSFDDRLLNGVSALAAVVRSGGFAAAARSLNVSQPGISRAVARLEAQVGIRLLERTTRSVSLTDEGRRFFLQSQTDRIRSPRNRGRYTGTVVRDCDVDPFVDFRKVNLHLRRVSWPVAARQALSSELYMALSRFLASMSAASIKDLIPLVKDYPR